MRIDRLKQLYEHVAKLPDELWDFSRTVSKIIDCGTVGCALGHCPEIWPEVWSIKIYESFVPGVFGGTLLYRGVPDSLSGCKFFELNNTDEEYLFYEGAYNNVSKEGWLVRLAGFIEEHEVEIPA
jgi:hypothetical protein